MTRRIGPFAVSPIGLGCMNLSHAYGVPPSPDDAAKVLHRALDLGYTMLDSAALYGFSANETLIGNAIAHRRGEYVLTSKCGMTGVDGKRVIDGRPETIKRTCEESLARLKADVIDLYYLHRWDKAVPIEDSIGAMAELVCAGKVRALGLSEVSAPTLRRAHAVHPIVAVQSEYSLWTRNPEIAVLEACRELGAAFVAFSPLARGFLAGNAREAEQLAPKDIRRAMPRFQGANFAANEILLPEYNRIARERDLTPAQLALAWLLTRADHIVPIPGTTSLAHLEENWSARDARLDAATVARLDALINAKTVHGNRYNDATQPEIDTEN